MKTPSPIRVVGNNTGNSNATMYEGSKGGKIASVPIPACALLETIVEEIIAAVNNIIAVMMIENKKTENPIQNLSRGRVRGAIRNSLVMYLELRRISNIAVIPNNMLKPMFIICPEIAISKTHYLCFFI